MHNSDALNHQMSVIDPSVEMLPEDEQQRFAELSVFATDQTVGQQPPALLGWFPFEGLG